MAQPYQVPRGTRSALNAKASAGTILVGQIYLITDEGRLAIGTSTTTYQALPKQLEDGPVNLTGTTTPATPTAGISLFRRTFAGRSMLGNVDTFGETTTYQPHEARNKIAMWNAAAGTTTAPAIDGLPPFTMLGNATARTPATTNIATRARRLGIISGAATASFAGMYSPIAAYTLGGVASGIGGVHFITRFAVSDTATSAGPRMFCGLGASVAAPTNVEPSATNLPNHIGLTQVSGSTNLQMLISGASSGTLTDLGTSFPGNTPSTEVYELQIFSPANASLSFGYRVERLSTGAVAEVYPVSLVSGNYPTNTTLLAPRFWRTTNASTTAVGLDMVSVYVETDN